MLVTSSLSIISNRRSLREERGFPSRSRRSRSRCRRSRRRFSSSPSNNFEARSITEDSELRRGRREEEPGVGPLDRLGGSAKMSKGSFERASAGRRSGRSLGGRGRPDEPREAPSGGGRVPFDCEEGGAGAGLIDRFSCDQSVLRSEFLRLK